MQGRLAKYLMRLVSTNKPTGLVDLFWLGLLSLLELIYRVGIALRNFLYQTNLVKKVQLPCTVISVGNITAGGTGKTPVVEFLSRVLQDNGDQVCILTRGYKSELDQKNQIGIVSDQYELKIGPEVAGDEAFLLATNLPGVPVVIGKNRSQTGALACTDLQCEVAILDDGFQYAKLDRQLDIVVIDATNPFGNGHLIPRGFLREPVHSLRRANIIIITHTDQVAAASLTQLMTELRKINSQIPIFTSSHRPSGLLDLASPAQTLIGLDKLVGEKVIAVSGIGNPQSFERTLTDLGCTVLSHLRFPDHHQYSATDLEEILHAARKANVQVIVTTQKDAVKIPHNLLESASAGGLRFLVLRISLHFEDEEEFRQLLINEVQQ